MKRLMLVAALLAGPALATPASAVQFTLSNAFGTGDFGSATAFYTDATTVHVDITMAPNFVDDTGSHWALTLSLLGDGRIDGSSFNKVNGVDVFTAQPHLQLPTTPTARSVCSPTRLREPVAPVLRASCAEDPLVSTS